MSDFGRVEEYCREVYLQEYAVVISAIKRLDRSGIAITRLVLRKAFNLEAHHADSLVRSLKTYGGFFVNGAIENANRGPSRRLSFKGAVNPDATCRDIGDMRFAIDVPALHAAVRRKQRSAVTKVALDYLRDQQPVTVRATAIYAGVTEPAIARALDEMFQRGQLYRVKFGSVSKGRCKYYYADNKEALAPYDTTGIYAALRPPNNEHTAFAAMRLV